MSEARNRRSDEKRRFSVTLTPIYIRALDAVVDEGHYMDHQDAIRHALRHLFQHHGIKSFSLEAIDGPPNTG